MAIATDAHRISYETGSGWYFLLPVNDHRFSIGELIVSFMFHIVKSHKVISSYRGSIQKIHLLFFFRGIDIKYQLPPGWSPRGSQEGNNVSLGLEDLREILRIVSSIIIL